MVWCGVVHRWEGGLRGLSWIVAPGLIKPGTRYGNMFHVTDWVPTLAAAAGIDLTSAAAGGGFEGIDGVSHWQALTALGGDSSSDNNGGGSSSDDGASGLVSAGGAAGAAGAAPPRTEILFNIEGVNGTGTAAIRVGQHKLLRSAQHNNANNNGNNAGRDDQQGTAAAMTTTEEQEAALVAAAFRGDGPPSAVPSLGMDWWCDTCTTKGGCDGAKPAKAQGGVYCSNTTLNATAAAAASPPHYAPTECGDGYLCYVFDVIADPTESNNLAESKPELLATLLAALARYQEGNVPCCSCTLTPDQEEMALPPKGGVWYTFHDESDPTAEASPLCDLLREPPRNK